MTVSFYLPKEINSVIDKVVSEGNTTSPNYISSAVVSPSILKRNLVKAENTSVKDLDINIIPLKLPTQHSTGNILKARTFDYDFIVANTDDSRDEPVFIIDTGSFSFRLKFKEKHVTTKSVLNPDTDKSTDKLQFEYVYDILESHIENDGSDLVPRPFKVSSFKNTEDVLIGDTLGGVSVKVLKEYNLPKENAKFSYNSITNLLYIVITDSLDTVTDKNLQDVTLLFSSVSPEGFSNVRLAGGVTYQPVLDSFYTNKTITEDIPNMRDYLDNLGINSYLGYSVLLKPYEGLLFNYEIGTTSDKDYTLENIPEVFDIGNACVFVDYNELFVGQSFLVTAPEIVKVDFSSKDDINPIVFEGGTPKEWYTFFKEYGVHCRVVIEDNKLTKLYMNRINSTHSDLDLTFNIYSTSASTLQTSPDFRELSFDDLGGLNNHPEKIVKTSTVDTDELLQVRTVIVSRNVENKELSSNVTYLGTKQIKAIQFSANAADTLKSSDYSTGISTYTYTAEVSDKLKAYGFETLLEGLAENLETNLNLQTVIDMDKGIVHATNMTTLLDNLYVNLKYSTSVEDPISYVSDAKEGPYNLVVDSNKTLVSGSESVVYLDHTGMEVLPTIDNNCSSLILDLSLINSLSLQPYAYRVLADKVEEQDSYIVEENLAVATNKLKSILKNISPFFTSISPLYVDDLVTDKVLIQIDSIDIDSKQMKNILLWTDELKEGFVDGYDKAYKVLTGYLNGLPVLTEITPELNSSLLFEGKFLSLNRKYGNSNYYSTNIHLDVPLEDSVFTIKVEDVDGVVEEQSFNVTSESTLTTLIEQSTLDSLLLEISSGNLKVSLAVAETRPRLKVSIIKETSTVAVINSGLAYEDDSEIIVMLNKG